MTKKSKKEGAEVETSVPAEVADTDIETTDTEVETETTAEATPEEEVDYNAGVIEILAQAGEEHRKSLTLTPLEERIGRNVAVRLQFNDGEKTHHFDAPRQVVIQALFEQNWHRRAITELFEGFNPEVPYQIIFAATKNMANEHHTAGKTASPGTTSKRGKTTEVSVKQADGSYATQALTQPELVRAYASGNVEGSEALTRGQIAEKLGISYGTVYQASKDLEMPDARKTEGAEGKSEKKKSGGKKGKAPKAAELPAQKTDDLPTDETDGGDVEADSDLMP